MAKEKQEDKTAKRRLRASYVTTVISTTFVLLLIGLFGLFILYAKKLSNYVKENVSLQVVINDGVNEAEIMKLKKTIDASGYVKSTNYITKEMAKKEFIEVYGEDFEAFLGYNPLLPNLDVHVLADYANNDSLKVIQTQLGKQPGVKEVRYDPNLVELLNKNIRYISIGLLIFSVILFFVALVLINNTIRLSIYSKRFIIRSMQLVGATQCFIRRPFIWKGIFQGFLSAILALSLMVGILFLAIQQIPDLMALHDIDISVMLIGFVLAVGILISWFSTFFAVRKYLKIKTDKLYL